MKFGAISRLGRITALLVFAIVLSGLSLCANAAQPHLISLVAARGQALQLEKPLTSYTPGDLPLQRPTTEEVVAEYKRALIAASQPNELGRVIANAPTPSPVAPQFIDLTTVPPPPFIGNSTLSFEKHPHWSWDQQSIYFASNHPGNAASYGTIAPTAASRFHIWRMTSDGSTITQVTGLGGADANQEQTYPTLNFSQTKLAFVNRDPATAQSQLYVLDFFTNTRVQLTGPGANAVNNPLNAEIRAVEHPSWSPNDNMIVFSAVNVNSANVRDIYVVDTSSKFVRKITNATNGVQCIDPVYDPTNTSTPRFAFAANAPSVNGGTGDLNYTPNALVDLRQDGSANDINHNLFLAREIGIAPATPVVRLTSDIADDIEPAYNRSIHPLGSGTGAFSGWLAWSSLGRDTGSGRGTTYDIYFNNGNPGGNPEPLTGNARPQRLFTPDTNGGSIALNQSEERYPTWSAGLPIADPINRIAFSSNRKQVVTGSSVSIGVGNPATESDLWVADVWDITPPTLFYFNPQQFPGEVLHIANQPLPNPGSRIGQAGDTFYFYANVKDGQYGVESVWAQIKDPDGPATDAAGENHRLYGTGVFPGGGGGTSNNVFIIRRDGNNAPTHFLHVPFETDFHGISVSDYTYYVDGRPAGNPNARPDPAMGGLRARFASKNPGVDDAPRWSGNQNSATNPTLTSNRPPIVNGQNAWLQLHDDGVFPDMVAGDDIYSASWVTPNTPSDFYVDLIAYDKAVNPQNTNQQQNWIIYDNVHGFSTAPFTSTRDVLYVDDNGAGQKWLRGARGSFRRFPSFRIGHESDIIERDPAYYPTQYFAATGNTAPLADPGASPSQPLDWLRNTGGDFITWSATSPTPRGTLRQYHYDWWRILAKGPIPETVLNNYVPTTEDQPRRSGAGTYTTIKQPIPRRAVVWNAPYTGDIFSGGGSILDTTTQNLLATYRSRAGRLVVAGGDILWALANSAVGPFPPNSFAATVLGAAAFNGDTSANTANYSGTALAQAITRDVVSDAFAPGTTDPFWPPFFDPEVIGANNNFLDGSHGSNVVRATNADAIPFETNDSFTAAAGWQQVYDGKWIANDDSGNTQSKTVFVSNSLASAGRYYAIEDDDQPDPALCMNYRAKISHAMFCWMFSADLSGRVTNIDAGGAPISGAFVEALQGGQVVGAAFTNANGFYQIRGLPVGGWALRVSAPGFVTFNKSTSDGAHGLGLSSEDFQVKEATPGSITGTVLDTFGQPVPNVVIRAVLQAGPLYAGERNYFGTTGPDGTYLINNVPAGDAAVPAAYVVSVDQLPPLFQNPTPASQVANVISAQNTPNIDFTVEGQPGPLTVSVFQEVNGAKGPAISGAEVALLDASNNLIQTGSNGVQPNNPLTTNGSGVASFSQVPAGPIRVSAFKIGFQEVIQVVPIPQQNSVEILLAPATPRALYVRVLRAADNQPLQAADLDTPVTVRLLRRQSRLPITSAQVFAPPVAVPNGNGATYNLAFPNAQDGDYIVAFEDPNHPRFVGGPGLAEVPVTITSTEPNIAPDLVLQGKSGVVTGVVKSTAMGNPPIEGVSVTFTPAGGGAPTSVLTNASGQFNSGVLLSDLYTVTVSKFGYQPPMAPIQVFVAGDRNLGDILMTPSPRGEVYGLVTLSTNGALRDVIVRFTPQGAPGVYFDSRSDLSAEVAPDAGTQNYTTALSTTDQTNAPAVNLPQATYSISILGLNGQPDPRFSGFNVSGGSTVVVAGNDQQRKDITLLPASGTITGTVRDANTNAAVSGAIVRVHQGGINGNVVSSVNTNAQGQFTTGVLPGGAYTLEITHPNYNTGTFAQIVEGNITAQPNPLLLTPKPPSAITGTVRSKVDNTLIGGVTVQLLRSDGVPVSPGVTDTTTDTIQSSPTRNYRLFPVAPGNYIVRVSKSGWKPAQTAVTVLPGADLNGINFQLDPEFLFGAGLLLIALPDNYGNADAAALLNLNLAATPPERTAYWVTDQNRYAIYPESEAQFFAPGKGMFVRLNSPRAFFQSGTPVPNAPFSLPLKTGWNLIGSPRRERIDWLKVKVQTGGGTLSMQEAMSQGIIQNGLFGYADGYFRSDFLDPFRGYFVRAFQNCTLIIPVNNTSASVTPAERFKVAALPAPTPAQVAAELGVPGRGKAPAVRNLNRLPGRRAASPLSGLFDIWPWTPRAG